MPLWLVGMMGSGKTTVGRELAHRRAAPFLDTDKMVEEESGLSIDRLFTAEGEAGFRDHEAAAVSAAALVTQAVVATGGGVVTRDENVAVMKSAGIVVWLQASVDTLLERLAGFPNRPLVGRPLLEVPDRRSVLEQLLDQRTAFYVAASDFTIDTDHLEPPEAVTLLEAMWTG